MWGGLWLLPHDVCSVQYMYVCMCVCVISCFPEFLSTPITGSSLQTGNSKLYIVFPSQTKRCTTREKKNERKKPREKRAHLEHYLYNVTNTLAMLRTIYIRSAQQALYTKTVEKEEKKRNKNKPIRTQWYCWCEEGVGGERDVSCRYSKVYNSNPLLFSDFRSIVHSFVSVL